METLPLSEVKARLSEIADEVDRTHARVNITRNGRAYVVLMSATDLESMEATMELLADSEAVDRLRTAEADVAAGDFVTATEHEPADDGAGREWAMTPRTTSSLRPLLVGL